LETTAKTFYKKSSEIFPFKEFYVTRLFMKILFLDKVLGLKNKRIFYYRKF